MATEVLQVWPAEIHTDTLGRTHYRVRTVLLTTTTGEHRHAIIDADGVLIEDVPVDSWQINGSGADVSLTDGRVLHVGHAGGCSSCGSSYAAKTAAALVESY